VDRPGYLGRAKTYHICQIHQLPSC